LTEAGLSIRTKRTPHQYEKSNNTTQDDEEHNATLGRRKNKSRSM